MKLAYEKPMMMAEAYTANSYIAACTVATLLDTLEVLFTQTWYSKLPFSFNGYSNTETQTMGDTTKNDLKTTYGWTDDQKFIFKESSKQSMKNNNDKSDQYYWTSDNLDGQYYLEWSNPFSTHNNKDVYFLYKETNGDSGLQVGTATSWPQGSNYGDNGSDRAIAAVTYQYGTTSVGS